MAKNIDEFLSTYQQRNDAQLAELLAKENIGAPLLQESIAYSLLAGGKRIRPILVYGAALSVTTPNTCSDRFACAIEAIHCYSLIHDDLPAMDNDDLRRGLPTNHIRFGDGNAILAGDALQALAFSWLTTTPDATAEIRLQAVQILANAAGAGGMISGQSLDLLAENKQITLVQLEEIHRKKTGALIEASLMLGGLSVGANSQHLQALTEYGVAIGLAFQVKDDILDVEADTITLGKQSGSDQSLNKSTYVALLGLSEAKRKADDLLEQAIAALSSMDSKADPLRWLAQYIVRRER